MCIRDRNRQITDYLVKISELDLPIADAKILGGLFHVVNDIERIGDHAENFAEAAKERMEKQIPFSEKAIRQIREMAEMVTEVQMCIRDRICSIRFRRGT